MTTLDSPPIADRRRHERLALPPMYTLARVRFAGDSHYRWTGHLRDVSSDGALLEIDQDFVPGTRLEIRVLLPGPEQVTFHARGTVVRVQVCDHWHGLHRFGLRLDAFALEQDKRNLSHYLDDCLSRT